MNAYAADYPNKEEAVQQARLGKTRVVKIPRPPQETMRQRQSQPVANDLLRDHNAYICPSGWRRPWRR